MDLKVFVKSYWEYYLELENQFAETKRFVAFDKSNSGAFSVEYLKLFQAVCSEIDVVGKEIAAFANADFNAGYDTDIKKWGYEVQQLFPNLKDTHITFDDVYDFQPFKNWEYEIAVSKDGKKNLRRANKRDMIKWWKCYTDVKHQRIGLVTGTKNFNLANQKNLITAFSALYLLEQLFMGQLGEDTSVIIESSKIFKIV